MGRLQPLEFKDQAQQDAGRAPRQLIGFLVAETNRGEPAAKVVRKASFKPSGLKKTPAAVEQQLRQVVRRSPAQSAKERRLALRRGASTADRRRT
jgi:hypothetical protein